MMIKAGTGTRELDVPSGCPLLGHPGLPNIATGRHDPLLATALHVRTGVHGALFIALDLYGLDPYQHQRIRDAVAAATGVHRDRIFMGCTHTHAGPISVWSYAWKDDIAIMGPDSVFLEAVAQTTIAAAAEACATTRPVTLGLTQAASSQGTNTASSLAFRQDDGALAALLTVSNDPVARVAPTNTQISAGTPFFFRERIRSLQGGAVPVVFFAAPTGGRTPNTSHEEDFFTDTRHHGYSLADATYELLKTADWHAMDDRSEISFRKKALSLPFREFPDSLESTEQAASQDPGPEPLDRASVSPWRDAMVRRAHAQAVMRLADLQRRGQYDQVAMLYGTAEALVVGIGSLILIGLPGNPPPETAAMLTQALPDPVWVAAHVNGFLQGDMVSIEQEQRGEFGAMPCPFAAQGMNALAESILAGK